ncbi:RICIN domain-containing protein [Kitasatospora sp. NPDC101183]|uniref:RICIN domain-containing protein n=1 Tax=Kitasatospora sp. NPDC101183 TaxID=3364100 RepID=UPI00382B3A6A
MRTSPVLALPMAAALCLGLVGAIPEAVAADAPAASDHTQGAVAPIVGSPTVTPTREQQAYRDALARAKSTGKPVVVDAWTTETSQTSVSPNGRLSSTDTARPVRAKVKDAWAALDPTLHRNADGTLAPAVSGTGLTLSGGGTGPMAVLTTPDGKKLSVTAPFALPAPALDGDTATYPGVLPDVDLQVTALPAGGWRNVLVVRTAAAAARPELKSLVFRTGSEGLTVQADAAGNITAVDDKGQARFNAPTPLQWDSATAPAPGLKAAAKAAQAAGDAAPAAEGGASTPQAPGDHAVVAPIAVKVGAGTLELTPDATTFGKGTGPWYLDPTVAATSTSQGSVEVQENHTDAKNYNILSNVATGFCGFSDCQPKGRQRSYFKIGLNPALSSQPSGAPRPPTVYGSTLNTNVSWAANSSQPTPFGAYWADNSDIGTWTDWWHQPCGTSGRLDGCTWIGGNGSFTGYGTMNIDVSWGVQQAVARGRGQMIIGIAPDDEYNMMYRHRFSNNPSITTDFDLTPSIWYPRTLPSPGFASTNQNFDCTSGGGHPWDNAPWIGSNKSIQLAVNSWSPTGFNLYTGFHVWDDNDANWSALPGTQGGSYNSPAVVDLGSLADGHQYGYNAQVTDGTLTSDSSAWCYFRVDKTPPQVSISSTDFPPSGTPNDNPTAFSDTNAWFTLHGTDPAPGNGLNASGLACFRVSTSPTPVTGWRCGDPGTVMADGNGNANFQHVAGNWGTNIVYAQAQDNAGNYSQPASYAYYAPWRPGTLPVFGDVDGDRNPDILRPDGAGNLTAIGANIDPTRTTSAVAASAPGNDQNHHPTWNDYLITHRGALVKGSLVDQVFAHNTRDPDLKKLLSLVYNDGTGHFDRLVSTSLKRPTQCVLTLGGSPVPCSSVPDFASDWSSVDQLLALGTPEGESTAPGANGTLQATRTSLLTVENHRMWLFRPGGVNALSDTAQLIPTAPGTGDWAEYDLINPGPANGPTKVSDTVSVNQATLWARHRATGKVLAYGLSGSVDAVSGLFTVDYSAFTNPSGGRLILDGSGTNATDYPYVGSSGDLNGDGLADLWTIAADGRLHIWRGTGGGAPGWVNGFKQGEPMGKVSAAVSIRSVSATGSCLDASGGARPGATMAYWGCWDTQNQRFNLATDGTVRNSGYCLSVKGNSLTSGTGLEMQPCSGLDGQKWAVRGDGTLRNTVSDLCVDLPGGSTANGTQPILYACAAGPNQRWVLNPEKA